MATPTNAQAARYEPMKSGTPRTRPLMRVCRTRSGAAPGNIIAAIIATQTATKKVNDPRLVATPKSMPFICRTAAAQEAAAAARVAHRTNADVLALVMAT
jgi:hypothetical protein